MKDKIQLIVGLGNPGDKYAHTRHNAGAEFVEQLAARHLSPLKPEKKYHGLYARVQWQGLDLHLLNPSTFMNRSGLSVKALADFFRITPEQILIAHDELDLPPGTAKLKKGGGHVGHNGLRDTIAHLGTNDFQRLRLGIGHPGDSRKVTGYVLGRLGKQEAEQLNEVFSEVLRELPNAATGKLAAAMNQLHSVKPAS
jgi:PTH1 family peptidyl-tRNA hydrolase